MVAAPAGAFPPLLRSLGPSVLPPPLSWSGLTTPTSSISFSPHYHLLSSPNPTRVGQEKSLVGGDTGSCRATGTAHLSQSPLGYGHKTHSQARRQKSIHSLPWALSHRTTLLIDVEPTYKEGFVWPKVGLLHSFFYFTMLR